MSLNNAAVVTAPSAFAPTGGTTLQFASMGSAASGKLTLYVPADTDLRVRRTMDLTAKQPAISTNAPNGYTQARAAAVFKLPKVLANGKITVGTARVELAYDVEFTTAEINQLKHVIAQAVLDSDFDAVWSGLSLA